MNRLAKFDKSLNCFGYDSYSEKARRQVMKKVEHYICEVCLKHEEPSWTGI